MIENLNNQFDKLTYYALLIFSKYENYNVCKFKNAFKTFNGFAFKSKFYVPNSKNKLITIKNIDDSGFNSSSVSFLNNENVDNSYLLEIGDILLTMTGNIGRCGIVDEKNCYLNQRVLKLNCQSKLYLYCFLLKHKNEIINLGKGTAQLNLSLEDLKDIIVHNSLDEISLFKSNDCLFNMLVNLKTQIKKLISIKNNLLSKYF